MQNAKKTPDVLTSDYDRLQEMVKKVKKEKLSIIFWSECTKNNYHISKGGYAFLDDGFETKSVRFSDLTFLTIGITFSTYGIAVQKDSYYNRIMSESCVFPTILCFKK